MHLKPLLTLGLASLTMAAQMDAPAIKSMLTSINTGIQNLDKSINAITEANVATQITDVNIQIVALNKIMVDSSARVKSSKALGLLDMSSLSSSAGPVQKSMTTLLTDIIAKRPIIVKGNQVEKLFTGLKGLKVGSAALQESMMTQIPSQLAGQMKGGAVPAAPTGLNIDAVKFEDLMFDVASAVFKGTDTTVKVSGSIWPLPASKKREIAFQA